MVFWAWPKDHWLKNELNVIQNGSEVMAKTIRSHPTSPFALPEPIWGTFFTFWKLGPNNDLPSFSSLPDRAITNQTGPQRNKDAHGPSLHIRFLSKCDFWYGIYHQVSIFRKTLLFKLVFNSFVYLRFKYGRPSNSYSKIELLFQNRTLMSKAK